MGDPLMTIHQGDLGNVALLAFTVGVICGLVLSVVLFEVAEFLSRRATRD